MAEDLSVWLRYEGRAFPDREWRDHLRPFNVKWSRTKSTDEFPIWYAVEGQGYVAWISDARPREDHWRIIISISASAPANGVKVLQEIAEAAVVRFPAMRIEKRLAD